MTEFRRQIAIFVLALFACQTVMAGIGEHFALFADREANDSQHSLVGHFADNKVQHGQSGTPDLVDTDCCHAHGHCHILAFAGGVSSASEPHGHSFPSLYSYSYHALFYDPLLRPPTSA